MITIFSLTVSGLLSFSIETRVGIRSLDTKLGKSGTDRNNDA